MAESSTPSNQQINNNSQPEATPPDYSGSAPGRGYTVPYGLPPKSWSEHGKITWQRYGSLRRRARANSMSWWGMKIIQGLLIGGSFAGVGLLLIVVSAMRGGVSLLSTGGIIVLLLSLLTILRYGLAPVTCKWIVTVPENGYGVVEDRHGYTLEYLASGRMIVPWRWKTTVRNYVDFNTIITNQKIDVMPAAGEQPVTLEVTVTAVFNPVHADPHVYARLRTMTTREHFQALITRDMQDSVHKAFAQQTLERQHHMLRYPQTLEDRIAEQLAQHVPLGLKPASSRPVIVYVRTLPPKLHLAPDTTSVPQSSPPSAPADSTVYTATDTGATEPDDTPFAPPGDTRDPLAIRRHRKTKDRRKS